MLSGDNVWEGLLTTLNGPLLGSIPIIGWAKTLIMAPFMSRISPLPLFSVLLASTLAVVALSIYYAVDFMKSLSLLQSGHRLLAKETCQASKAAAKSRRRNLRKWILIGTLRTLGFYMETGYWKQAKSEVYHTRLGSASTAYSWSDCRIFQ